MDFSHLNLEYFLTARDLANENLALASSFLGVSPGLTRSLALCTPAQLCQISSIKIPLVAPRKDAVWWNCFIRALAEGNQAEISSLVDQAGYYLSDCQGTSHE